MTYFIFYTATPLDNSNQCILEGIKVIQKIETIKNRSHMQVRDYYSALIILLSHNFIARVLCEVDVQMVK